MLHFPEVEDVRLRRAPLAEVIAQVRFPTLLRIATEAPTAFQERIRQRFPLWSEEEQGVVAMIPTLADAPARVQKAPSIHRFRSHDEKTTVSLAVDFYALSTTAYTHWVDFWEELLHVREAVEAVYAPAAATRLGLRYVNRFMPAATGQLSTVEALLGVLRPELVELLAGQPWGTALESIHQIAAVGQCEPERMVLRVGFSRLEDEPLLMLDLDYYVEEGPNLQQLQDFYERAHDVIYRAFRWSIRDDQLGIFDPMPQEEV